MAPRSSHNKHSDGNSRHGNELGGHRSGSTPRNRHNSYEGSGTDRSNVPGPNSNSEGTRDTSSESRRRDHSQEATDSQDHGNTERDEPGDPGNRKRQLNRAVNEYLGSSKKFKSDLPYVFFSFFFTSILTLSFIVEPRLSINFITGPVASFDTLARLYTCGQPLLRDLDWPLQRGLPPRPPLGE